MRRSGFVCLSVALVAVLASAAQAGQISYTQTISLATTNWDNAVSIPKFNGPGTLIGVTLQLNGHVEGSAKFESLDCAPATVTMDLQAAITLMKPDCTTIVQVLPMAETIDCVTAYDGVTDYGGTSGATHTGLAADAADCAIYILPGDLALFTGPGNIVLPVNATGTSTGSGNGNLVLVFATSASSSVTVTYFTDVPEPATVTLVGSGLLIAVGVWRRRRMR